jgi:hypothetical protein
MLFFFLSWKVITNYTMDAAALLPHPDSSVISPHYSFLHFSWILCLTLAPSNPPAPSPFSPRIISSGLLPRGPRGPQEEDRERKGRQVPRLLALREHGRGAAAVEFGACVWIQLARREATRMVARPPAPRLLGRPRGECLHGPQYHAFVTLASFYKFVMVVFAEAAGGALPRSECERASECGGGTRRSVLDSGCTATAVATVLQTCVGHRKSSQRYNCITVIVTAQLHPLNHMPLD